VSATTLKQLDPTQVELEIAISPDELQKAQNAAFGKLVRNVKMAGFRPGKVPRKIFEAQYGVGVITERAMEDLVPEKYAEAVEEHKLEPIARPQMELLPEEEGAPLRFKAVVAVEEHKLEPIARPQMELLPEEEGAPLRFKAVVTVRPQFELKTYTGLEITEQPTEAGDEELDTAIETLRRDAATLVPVDRAIELGDTATLDYEGKIDGVPFDGGTATGEPTEILESRFIPGFASGIVGMKAGETKDVTAHFPDDYSNKDLAGKDALFTIAVHEVKEPEMPVLDDEFAKRVARLDTVDALKVDLRRRLSERVKENARRAQSQQILDQLIATHEVPLPAVLVERETQGLIDESKQYVARFGTTWEQYLEQTGKTEDDVRAEYTTEAEKRVKTTLVVEAIAKAENVQATQGDIEAELAALSAQYQQPPQKIIEMMGQNVGALVDGVVRTKTIDLLIERAKVVPAATKPSEK